MLVYRFRRRKIYIARDTSKISEWYGDDITPGKRVLVTFTPEQVRVLHGLRGNLGRGDAEVIRTIVLSWLIARGYLPQEPGNRTEPGLTGRSLDAQS
ncbi:MAG TPA: hypothetical protein VF944_01505 [Candidatus Bathyarchaeia archaeon]